MPVGLPGEFLPTATRASGLLTLLGYMRHGCIITCVMTQCQQDNEQGRHTKSATQFEWRSPVPRVRVYEKGLHAGNRVECAGFGLFGLGRLPFLVRHPFCEVLTGTLAFALPQRYRGPGLRISVHIEHGQIYHGIAVNVADESGERLSLIAVLPKPNDSSNCGFDHIQPFEMGAAFNCA